MARGPNLNVTLSHRVSHRMPKVANVKLNREALAGLRPGPGRALTEWTVAEALSRARIPAAHMS
eukprot:3325543-Rhodomonas_salina.2